MNKYLIICVTVFIFGIHITESSLCGNDLEEVCAPDGFFAEEIESMFPDQRYLEKHCSDVIEKAKCVIHYNETCDRLITDDMPFTFPVILKLLEDICKEDSELGRGYRQNIKCVNDLSGKIKELIGILSFETMAFQRFLWEELRELNESRFNESRAGYLMTCLTLFKAREEFSGFLEVSCGTGAKDTFLMILRPLTTNCDPSEMEHYVSLFDKSRSSRRPEQRLSEPDEEIL